MDEYTSIFVESTEDMGVQFDSYELLLSQTNTFLDTIEKFVSKLNKDPDTVDMDLTPDINEYKKKALVKCKPKPIELKKIKAMMKKISEYQTKLSETLKRYAKVKDSIAYGGNFTRAILKRPKVYSKEISEEKYGKINEEIRAVNRAMDWVEKVLLDLYNLTDQDLNILEIVNVAYNKTKIYESYKLPAGVIDEDVADSVIPMNPAAIDEASWHNATHDKKSGAPAPYISRNHDMANYGEGEPESPDDYKRPSAQNDDQNEEPAEEPEKEVTPTDTSDDTGMIDNTTPETKQSSSGTVNNYYYTYNNSLNKHHSDDHSVHNKTMNDDHSVNKHINSDNGLSAEDLKKIKADDGMYHKLESCEPWKLDLGMDEVITEGVINNFKKRKELTNALGDAVLQKVKDPNVAHIDLDSLPDKEPDEDEKDAKTESAIGKLVLDKKSSDILQKIIADRIKSGDVKTMSVNDLLKMDSGKDDDKKDKAVTEASTIGKADIKKIIDDKMKKGETVSLKELEAMGDDFTFKIDPQDPKKPIEPMKILVYESLITEEVGDADDMKPESDHPIKDIMTDFDRKTVKVQQKAKKAVQNTVNAGRAIVKPVKRTHDWINNMVMNWRDVDETKVKEKMADPEQRKGLLNAIRKAIRLSALAKAGLLLNPVILFLSITKKVGDKKKSYRIRNEMIGELKNELDIIDEKIHDAEAAGDRKAKYKLMRFKNELKKKLIRVEAPTTASGASRWSKVI